MKSSDHHVVCQSFTCAACTDAVVHAGGTPVIADVELDTFSLDFKSVQSLIQKDDKIVGVLLASIYGCPSRDLHVIRSLCTKKGIWLLEDNCESYGAISKDKPLGCFGDMSVISLRSEKMIGAGEGGAILSKCPQLVAKAKWWCSRAPREGGLWLKYCNTAVGQNFLMPELTAAVALAGAKSFVDQVDKKRRIHQWYCKHLCCRIDFQIPSNFDTSVHWLNAIILPCAAEPIGTALALKCPEIEIRPGFYPLSRQYGNSVCVNSEYLYKHVICLPSSTKLLEEDIVYICEQLKIYVNIL